MPIGPPAGTTLVSFLAGPPEVYLDPSHMLVSNSRRQSLRMWVDRTCKQVFPELSARFALCRETTSLQAAREKGRIHASYVYVPARLICHNFSAGGQIVSRKCESRTRHSLQLWFVVDWTIGCGGQAVKGVHVISRVPFMPTLHIPRPRMPRAPALVCRLV